MKVFVVLALCFATVSSINLFQAEWEAWKKEHGKEYEFGDEMKRQYIWTRNLKEVIKHNLKADQGIHTYRLGMNQFADLDVDEWRSLILSEVTRPADQPSKCETIYKYNEEAVDDEDSIDWRTEGFVTPVKDQGNCGACWAFSATGALEGQHVNRTGLLMSLSEQNLIDCSAAEGDFGCQGGLMDNAFEYVKKNGGIDTEDSYPYTAMNGASCKYNVFYRAAMVSGCVDIPSRDEKSLKSAVSKVGPISVAIDAGHLSFQLYQSGVYKEPACSNKKLDHGVLVVGYGMEMGEKYWTVKNSWGTKWGMQGYIMMARDDDNMCGIATQASYPVI